jgi:tripartite-type tricarboxylate transporter receptor subunit TctC
MPNRTASLTTLTLAALLIGAGNLAAEDYPSRTVTMVVPFAAGGGADVVARIVADGMRRSLGRPVVVENVTGAGGSIGVARVARAAPDGYTIGSGGWGTYVANGAFYALPYDLRTDFAPVSLLPAEPLVILARKDLPAANLQELVAWLKANPGKAMMGTTGRGSPEHVFALHLQKQTGTQFQFVSYRGAGQALQDLIAGQIDVMMPVAALALTQLHSGNLKVLAISTPRRSAIASEIPTVEEAGLPGLAFTNWRGVFAPRGTPKAIVARLNAAIADALAEPTAHQRLTDLGQEFWAPEQQTPEALGALQHAEIEKWWPIIKSAGITAE